MTLNISIFMRLMNRSFQYSLNHPFSETKGLPSIAAPQCQVARQLGGFLWCVARATDINKMINPIT